MRSPLAGLRQLVLPWGKRSGGRIVIGPDIPSAWRAAMLARGYTVISAILYYYSDNDFYFEASATSVGPERVAGAWASSALFIYEEVGGPGTPTGTNTVLYGSAGNGAQVWQWRGTGSVTFADDVVVTKGMPGTTPAMPIMPTAPMGSAYVDSAAFVINSAAVAEQVVPAATWNTGIEPQGDFEDGHIFRVVVTANFGVNALGSNTGQVTVRQGSASTVGNVVAQWQVGIPNGFFGVQTMESHFRNITGADKLGEILSLCFHRSNGAGTVAMAGPNGSAPNPLEVRLYDLGHTNNIPSQLYVRDMT